MLYGMRGSDGRHDRFSSGTFVDKDGRATPLGRDDFALRPRRRWRSAETGASYPVEWTIEVPRYGYSLQCRPLMDAQEVAGRLGAAPVYWEGAVAYTGERAGTPVRGGGYLEMTGYDKPISLGLTGRAAADE